VATFNARAETVETKPFFRDAFKRKRCLIPVSGYYEGQTTPSGKQPWYCSVADGSPLLNGCRTMGRMERSDDGRGAEVLHHDHHRAERLRWRDHDRMPVLLTADPVRTVAQRRHGS
jgi:putative SOS response-associated peptidase YedK